MSQLLLTTCANKQISLLKKGVSGQWEPPAGYTPDVLQRLPDVHARVDSDAAYNRMVGKGGTWVHREGGGEAREELGSTEKVVGRQGRNLGPQRRWWGGKGGTWIHREGGGEAREELGSTEKVLGRQGRNLGPQRRW